MVKIWPYPLPLGHHRASKRSRCPELRLLRVNIMFNQNKQSRKI